jgi:hypothetical protein
LDTDHYLLCAKIDFPPRWLNKNINKKVPSKQEEFFKIRLLNDKSLRWLYTQSEVSFKQYKGKQNRY